MNATETLKRVKAILGLTVSLEQMKLDNGTVIEAEKFEAGESVFIVTEDEKVALPVGEYELEDGTKLVVEEEGVIAQYGEEVEEVEEEETEEVEAEDEKELAYVSKEEFITALEEIVAMIEELKDDKKEMSEETETEQTEMSEVEEVEVTEEEVELNAQLSEPATEPLKHAPKEESKFTPKFKFNKNTHKSAYDVIVEKINNFNNK
jgi:hypothetical protein